MTTGTTTLDSKALESGIEALSRAARTFRLTRFEVVAYRALMVSVNVAFWGLVVLVLLGALAVSGRVDVELYGHIGAAVVIVGVGVATISLVLNIPLAYKLYRERARLRKLGLASLSKSLWKESRRRKWISTTAS